MKLSIYTIQSTIFDGEVESITLPTPLGEITVLDRHIPLISLVKPGEVRYTLYGDKKGAISLSGGMLEVRPESEVVLLAEEKV